MKHHNIIVRGKTIKFYPQGNESKFYFEIDEKSGFYTKDLFFYYGKPTIKNAVEVASNYIESFDFRIRIFDNLSI